MFACPNFYIDYPPLVFTSILNIDMENNNFPIDTALSEKAHASKKSTFIIVLYWSPVCPRTLDPFYIVISM